MGVGTSVGVGVGMGIVDFRVAGMASKDVRVVEGVGVGAVVTAGINSGVCVSR